MPRCTLIIPSEDRSRLLVRRERGRVELPAITIGTEWIAAEVGAIQAAARDTLGIEAIVLREIPGELDGRAVELEWIAGAPHETGAELVAVDALHESLPDIAARTIVHRWNTAAPEPDAPPWMHRGWLASASAWIDARLADLGAARVGPLRQVKGAWAESAVFAAASSAGDVYFKAAGPHSLEPAVLAALNARTRRGAPSVLALESEHKWMLMKAARGPARPARFRDALRQFAEMQRAEAPYAAEWLAAGVPDRGTTAIRARIERVLVGIPGHMCRGGLLSPTERAALGALVSRANALCDRLEACGIPDALVHDDFQPGNMLDDGGELVFIDWSDVAVAHPFFSAHHFVAAAGASSSDALRDAYLEPWSSVVGAAAAREAFDASAPLASVYRALFNDNVPDYVAWLATNPPAAQREFARGVFIAILEAFSAAH